MRKFIRITHLFGTFWFIAWMAFIIIVILRQAGVKWWLIFSLSGHSAVIVMLLLSVYLFALYRGITRAQDVIEHPLTSSAQYMIFYSVSPILGTTAGFIATIGMSQIYGILIAVATGTMIATFAVWVILDPVAGVIEMLTPVSYRHRAKRLSRLRTERRLEAENRVILLNSVRKNLEEKQKKWGIELSTEAEQLCQLAAKPIIEDHDQNLAVEFGLKAWQTGGLNCMQLLKSLTIEKLEQTDNANHKTDLIWLWWDGIGTWRYQLLD